MALTVGKIGEEIEKQRKKAKAVLKGATGARGLLKKQGTKNAEILAGLKMLGNTLDKIVFAANEVPLVKNLNAGLSKKQEMFYSRDAYLLLENIRKILEHVLEYKDRIKDPTPTQQEALAAFQSKLDKTIPKVKVVDDNMMLVRKQLPYLTGAYVGMRDLINPLVSGGKKKPYSTKIGGGTGSYKKPSVRR